MPRRFPPVGRCIYCGATRYSIDDARPLADEHIIPFALNGDYVLPEASCRQCERTTGQFEQVALRGILRGARVLFDYPSRKGHPETLPLYAHSAGDVFRIDVLAEHYPAIMHIMAPAWFVLALTDYHLDPKGQWFVWGGPLNEAGADLLRRRRKRKRKGKRKSRRAFRLRKARAPADSSFRFEMSDLPPERFYHRDGILAPSLHIPSFYKMIAKMAHAFTAATFGVDAFKPYRAASVLMAALLQ
jgi:hypothetical protein